MKFRYARRTMWRWQQYVVAGATKEEAVALAKENGNTYDANWLQASEDGEVWFDAPPAKDIPVVDETISVTGKVHGG